MDYIDFVVGVLSFVLLSAFSQSLNFFSYDVFSWLIISKLLLVTLGIGSMDHEEGGCYASNVEVEPRLNIVGDRDKISSRARFQEFCFVPGGNVLCSNLNNQQ